jgi:hypothetical protein
LSVAFPCARSKLLVGTLIALLVLVLAPARPTVATLADGQVLGSSNWEEAKGLLPDEILEHYKRDEYRNTIMDLKKPGYIDIDMPPDFQEASKANRGRYTLTDKGSIVDAKTGKQPRYIMGFPFPDVTADDPQAATKMVWNYFYNNWYTNGDSHFLTELLMLNRGGIERSVRTDVKILTYDGNPEARERPNPHNLLQQILARVVFPADLQGIVNLTWRYRDPGKRDSLWTYVPGLRRVRPLNPLNRSDGFMGSDMSLDDGAFFDGKPEDFTFRLLGKEDQLVIIDPFGVRGETETITLEGGGWRKVWKDVPRIGADDPTWRGLPWAPVSAVLGHRPVWVVEVKPRDPNYLYGRLLLRFDAETFHGTWASKYDRAGGLLMSYQVSSGAYFSPDDGRTFISGGGLVVQTAENFLYDRATVSIFPRRNFKNPSDFRVPHRPNLFSTDALTRLGK